MPRNIRICPIRSLLTYAIALHEIGHCVTWGRSGHAYPNVPYFIRQENSEILAWMWAQDNALLWTGPMDAAYRYSRRAHRAASLWRSVDPHWSQYRDGI